ncbi:MAG: TRAM domain-containing protein [Thermomicrobiales bacterium]
MPSSSRPPQNRNRSRQERPGQSGPSRPADRQRPASPRPTRSPRETYREEKDPAILTVGQGARRTAEPDERERRRGPGNHPNPTRPRQSDRPAPDMPPITVTIDRIVGDGKGIGFADGKTVFVARTAPGDVVSARVTRAQGKVLHAEIAEIVTPSPMRIEPRVADYEASGGLDLMHIGYADQLAVKASIIADCLRRIAKLDPVPEVDVVASPQEWEYRSRAEFQIDQKTKAVGYFAGQSHRVVDVPESPVLVPTVQLLLSTLRDDMQAGLVPATAREYRAVAGETGSVLEQTATPNSRMVLQSVGEETYRFAAECFFQGNIGVAAKMVQHIIRIAEEAKINPGYALDLYSGVGLFTVPLARLFKRTIAVESYPPATKWAETNIADANLANRARVVTAPVERWLADDRSPLGRVALAVFDPPRTGAGPEVIEALVKLRPAHIAAVSCDPATFARDLRGLLDAGYELVDVQGYDMFPQTHHVEIIGHLRRGDAYE